MLDRVEVHGADWGPVPRVSRPPTGRAAFRVRVHVVAVGQDRAVPAGVPVARRDVADAGVQVVVVVPADEALDPAERRLEALEGLPRVAGTNPGQLRMVEVNRYYPDVLAVLVHSRTHVVQAIDAKLVGYREADDGAITFDRAIVPPL